MATEGPSQLLHHLDLCDLLDAADFLKREGEDVSDGLRALERQILEGLSGDSGRFEGSIPQTLLPELGAEIFDTLLSNYLKWYRCSVVAANQAVEEDRLAFQGYAMLERPNHLGLGVTYEMANVAGDGGDTPAHVHKIGPLPGSVQVVVDASRAVRAVVAAMQIERTVNHMLATPADVVRKTLECRMAAAYGFREPIGDVGLAIYDGIVGVSIALRRASALA